MHLYRIFGRIVQSLMTLVCLMLAVFLLVRLTGSPVNLYLPLDASEEMRVELTQKLGLDQSVLQQFAQWSKGAAQFDFGRSLWHDQPAAQVVLDALPHTLALGGIVLSIAIVLAVVIGSLAAVKPHGLFDRLASAGSSIGASAPDFWVALMFVFLFSVELRWLPTSGSGGASYWVLPVATLVLRPFGILVQIVRGAVIVALAASFIKTAKAKGAQRVRVLFVHALPNALLPIVTVVGDLAAQLAGGVTVIETVFGWPGIGKLMIDAILQRDFPVMQAGILAVATVIVLINITVEVLYPIIDPRVRTS